MKLHQKLGEGEEAVFRAWARVNYLAGSEIPSYWHPAVRAEAALMDFERAQIDGEIDNAYQASPARADSDEWGVGS